MRVVEGVGCGWGWVWGEGWTGVRPPRVPPVLYQGVGLCVRVVALFEVSSGVEQGLLGAAEFGGLGLGQVSRLALGQCGGCPWLPLLHLAAGGPRGHGRGVAGGGGHRERRPLQRAALLWFQAGLARGLAAR